MAANFVKLDDSGTFTLQSAGIEGDSPTLTLYAKSADIVHSRNGQVVSVRSWSQPLRWRVVFPFISTLNVAQLKGYWVERTFHLQPAGSPSEEYKVYWKGDFSPQRVGTIGYSLSLELEEVPS